MLTIHHSNRLEALARELTAVMAEPLASPFAAEVVLVQSRGVERWLSLWLADATGICANMAFRFPNAYVWDLYRAIVGSGAETSAFDPPVLTWRIVGLLETLEDEALFAPVKSYVGGDPLRRYDLATRLAVCFDQYQLYRPEWIADWERGKPKHWQAALWRRLAKEAATPHRAALLAQLIKVLEKPLGVSVGVPQRLNIFGAPALAPELLKLFHALAAHSDVHLFVQNPCREYWGDIAAPSDIARRALAGKADAPLLETGNSLLASLGKQGRDFFDLLTEGVSERVRQPEHFVEPAGESLLAAIQRDILDLREPARDGRPPIGEDDRSVQVHSCHSAMREVEVLHDQLLALFSANPDLEPADVVVMTPDIGTYAPYIEAVFATAAPRIPYNVSDRTAEQESTLAATFMALLELPGSRYEASRVLGILDELSVQRRFGLTEGDLESVQCWVRDSRIRWGIDAEHRKRFDLPATHEHTWRFGLDRLLLGYALPGGNERLFDGVLPYDDVEGSAGGVLGRFQSFAEAAIALDSQLAGFKTIAHWCDLLHGLIARFFDPPFERAEELEAVRGAVSAIEYEALTAIFDQPLPLSVIVNALRSRLEVPGRAFLSGGVTFCAMVPMRTLPFEVVCMIGMNDGAFPRIRRRDGFDLLSDDFRKGDRSRREDDRYLFLESLVSAGRCLYMSYTGRHIREDTVLPPSVLVSDLLEYIERGYAVDRERLLTAHPLQAFSRRYFEPGGALFSYSATLRDAAAVAGQGTREPQPFLTQPLPPPEGDESRIVDLETFIRFFRNPARHLFQRRLNVRLEMAEEEIESREPFDVDSLECYELKTRLLDLTLRHETCEGLELARAGGVLPAGPAGKVLFEEQAEAVDRLAAEVARRRPDRTLDPIPFEIASGHVVLSGALTGVSPAGLFDYRPTKPNPTARMQAWLRHLVLNAIAPKGVKLESRCVTEECVLVFKPVPDARAQLEALLKLYWEGQHAPLHFFPRTACAYAKAGAITWPVKQEWGGGYERWAESDDPYFALAFRGAEALDEAFEHAAALVFGRMNEALDEEPLA